MKLDSRHVSKKAYKALTELASSLDSKYHKKASGLVQGLTAYISTWGLHRLGGDIKKFEKGRGEDTQYKGKVYKDFLIALKDFKGADFDVDDEGCFINMDFREYTATNRVAIELAREWSFWAPAILGEAEE